MDPDRKPAWDKVWKLYGRTIALMGAMVAGALLPQAESASALLPFFLMGMLFFSFLDITVNRETFHPSIVAILLANLAIPLGIYALLVRFNPDLALIGFITAIAPTATATPVIVGFLRGRVDYVFTAVLLTNIGVALCVPFLLPLVAGSAKPITVADVLPSVLLVMFVPLGLAWLVKQLPARVSELVRKGKPVVFPLWLMMLFTVTAKASAFLHANTTIPARNLVEIAALSLVTCILNFTVGYPLGGKQFHREASQALGQKNNSFTVWLALTYLNPLAALGPTFYVLYHNLYNGYQLIRHESRQDRPAD
jgi:bile acid:Na+ symporter, BASS family